MGFNYKDLVSSKKNYEKKDTILVALEGVDCSGKTTYLNSLCSSHKYNTYKVSINNYIDKTFLEGSDNYRKLFLYQDNGYLSLASYMVLFNNLIKFEVEPAYRAGIYDFIIFDRFLLSTYVYQCGNDPFKSNYFTELYNKTSINSIPTPVNVVLDPGLDVIEQRLNSKKKDIQEEKIKDKISKICSLYLENADEVISRGTHKNIKNKSLSLDMPLESEFLEYLKFKYA